MTLCECGCGEEVNPGRRFIKGHAVRCQSKETRRKQAESLRGHKHTEETKRKMSETRKGILGRKRSVETRRKISEANKGHPVSEETRRKIGKGQRGRIGKLAGNWQGGISYLPYCDKFNYKLKKKIRNRDNRKCQLCNATENGTRHTVHHVHYDKSNCYPDLITLCTSCNGKANKNRDYWEAYYMNKLNGRNLLFWTRRNIVKQTNSIL